MIYLLMIPINSKTNYKNVFLSYLGKKFISKEVYEFIRPVGSQRPRMFSLPKIHKPDVPLRPILSMCHLVQHSLVKWLVECLNPVLEFYSGFCVKDSFIFASIIRQLPFCNDSQFLVSFDIVSLFTNIPICAHFLTVDHQPLFFLFLKTFLLSWWKLPLLLLLSKTNQFFIFEGWPWMLKTQYIY